MFEIRTLLLLIAGLPLLATLVIATFGRPVLGPRSHLPLVVALLLSWLASAALLARVTEADRALAAGHAAEKIVGYEKTVTLWRWADVPRAKSEPSPHTLNTFRIDVTLRADTLTAVMLTMVHFVSLLVVIYSAGYMHGDRGYWRFFAYVGLFVFSMTMLVSVSNFLLLYVFWEAVGLCSYLLIGFWYEKPAAAAAGKKAFLVNRVGDFGFALGVFLIWLTYGTLDFHDTVVSGVVQNQGVLGQSHLAAPGGLIGGGVATAICLLLLLGACGKSAQFPLHVWLPDAMEGPTPVSALIHAATMVTAGIYMVARCAPLYATSPDALAVVATIGGFTALLAALIAITQTDLKRILAYSTISQLGYMFLGLGAGTLLGITGGMFHLVTHAFFKALLFLGAGSVMHAMGGVIDLRQFGGLRHRLPTTHWTFLFGCLALAGVFPFAGFWSKDVILEAVDEAAGSGPTLFLGSYAFSLYGLLYWTALATAGLTAFYTFRAYFLAFHGPETIPSEAGHHAHESPPSMTWPLVVLAVGALLLGAVLEFSGSLGAALARTPSLAWLAAEHETAHGGRLALMATSTAVALAGIVLAAVVYLGSPAKSQRLALWASRLGLYQLSWGKFFFDPLYYVLVVGPLRTLAWLLAQADRWLVDGLVDLVGRIPVALGGVLRPLQGGVLQFYALAMLLGLLVLIAAMMT